MSRPRTLVTGGTRGIGAAVAHRLARAGHDLVLGYAQDDAAAELAEADVEAAGGECTLVRTDLLEPGGVEALFAAAGRLSGVVNNAGATFHIGPLAETPIDVIRKTVDLNLTSAILVARAAVRALSTAYGGSGGVIVNISSGAATKGAPGEYVQYAAAKAGVDALTLGLAEEVADQGIRVVGVAPGMIRTSIHADAGEPGRLERVAPLVPLQRAGEPEEVAHAVAWLMSDEASYVTGTTLRVAGVDRVEGMEKPEIDFVDPTPPADLVVTDLVEGDGAEAASGNTVEVHYVGVAHSSGEEFDASYNRGEPLRFRLGVGQVIQGWDTGVQGMKVGGRRQLVIPPHLGYGDRGAGGVIKPGETLVFVVDLLGVS